ncbi:hypothetical protein CDD81_7022 [Ophiocordyceps australis]|uniref:Zn(2)-C6 fungal-type domain-containing protein n=1 Tax=Ophiocordyceps australis TaxID=1399860 RepID=A0A2C5YCV7_9HYPO|nr:hypothetical protein CDD81_7022 [Ophiocordyceps australis]
MSPGREGEQEEGTGLTYPSPGVEAMDAGPFYHASVRDGTRDQQNSNEAQQQQQQPQQQQQQQQQQHASEQAQAREHQESHVTPHEEPSPHQHTSPPTNLEELQLAAQLGDELAGTSMIHTTDPNMAVDEHGMRNIMPHPEPDQHHTPSYVHDAPGPEHMAQHSLPASVGPPLPAQYQMGDNVPPRKRSKVSRACDECRRKKIKCDAQSDTGDTPCSSCARSHVRCLFSRVPQKRGPSKGYIKELADRIYSIENKLESESNLTQDDIDKLFTSDRPRSHSNATLADESCRKRPFASISAGDYGSPIAARQTPWGSEARSLQPASAETEGFNSQVYTNNEALAPQAKPFKPETAPSRPPVASMEASISDADNLPSIDDGTLQDYLNTIQPIYPILPSNMARLQSLLSQCPAYLKSAFSIAILSVGKGSPGDTLTLLIIDADWRGSATLPYLLARALTLASSLRAWSLMLAESSDADSEDQLIVKIWLSLVLMDRWHAVGTGKRALIPQSSIVMHAGIQDTVGEVCFHLIRFSRLLNIIAMAVSDLAPGATTTDHIQAAVMEGLVENIRECLPAHITAASYPLVHLAYWHCRLLVTLLNPDATADDSMWCTRELANMLSSTAHLRSPMVHHYVSLAVLSLGKLVNARSTGEKATQLVKGMLEAAPGSHWDGVKDKLADILRPASSVEATASQGLQHLADLATAHEGLMPGGGEGAMGQSLASGYLNLI